QRDHDHLHEADEQIARQAYPDGDGLAPRRTHPAERRSDQEAEPGADEEADEDLCPQPTFHEALQLVVEQSERAGRRHGPLFCRDSRQRSRRREEVCATRRTTVETNFIPECTSCPQASSRPPSLTRRVARAERDVDREDSR